MAYNATQKYAPWILTPFLKSIGILADLGIVVVDDTNKITAEGNFIEIPKIDPLGAFARRDISTTSQDATFTEMGTTIEQGVVCHDDLNQQYLVAQEAITGAQFGREWAARMGLVWFRRAKQQLYRVAKTAVEVADTTDGSAASADIHISDVFSASAQATMTFTRLQDAKAKMGDRAGDMTVVVMHSTPWNNLVKDGISNYKIENASGRLLGIGSLDPATITQMANFGIARFETLGMTVIIDDDMSSISMSGSTYTYGTKYETLLLGANSLYLGYQRNVTVNEETWLGDRRGAVHRMRAEADYCPHLFSIKWNSTTTNPTDTQLGTKSNWDEVYKDHKECKCVKLITNG